MRFPGSPAQVAELKKAFHQGGGKGFLRMMVSQKANEGAGAIEVAALYSLLGETDQAFAWLGKAYQRRSPLMEFLKEDPDFDHRRSDPRFSELVRRAGFGGLIECRRAEGNSSAVPLCRPSLLLSVPAVIAGLRILAVRTTCHREGVNMPAVTLIVPAATEGQKRWSS